MRKNEDVDDILDDIESREIRIKAAQKGAGDRKKTILFTVGGAIAGAFVGDVLYGNDVMISGDLMSDGYQDEYFQEQFYMNIHGNDRAGIIEEYLWKDAIDDNLIYTDRYVLIEDVGGFTETTVDEGGPIDYPESILFSREDVLTGLADGTLVDNTIPTGSMAGLGAGASSGYAADRLNRKLKKKKILNDR